MDNEVIIHQTVHGYSEGHRLLATSNHLSEKDQRILLRLSDRSGDIVPGFEEYLTGYPLPDSNLFALAKTWHAPEMERPGCVWTHTLLIDREYFRNLTNIYPLKSLFVRPQKGRPFANYREPLSYVGQSKEQEFIFPWGLEEDDSEFKILYSELFKQLYEKIKSVVLFAENASQYEDFILSVWGQQWPELRSRFTFCTGSINGRSTQNHPFILQVSPYRNHSLLVHKYPNLTFIDTRMKEGVSTSFVKNEDYRILRHKNDPLIKFVWHYGEQMKPLRKNFGWLARFYNLTHKPRHKIQLSKITEYLASKFPLPDEMPGLKASLYGGDEGSNIYVTALGDETALLSELFKTKHYDIFDISKLNIYQRTIALWKNSHNDALRIARTYYAKMRLNPIRREFLQATAEQLQPSQVYDLFADKLSLLVKLIEYNPKLAATSALWLDSYQARLEIFEVLSKLANQASTAEVVDWRKIAFAMLDANTDDFTDYLYNVLNDELITTILDWHSQSDGKSFLKKGWTHYLGNHENKLIEWVIRADAPPRTKALVATYLSPHSPEVHRHGSSLWLDLAELGPDSIPAEDLVSVMVFLLALGLMNLDQDSYRLVAGSFQSVYDAASSDSIPNRSWSYLDKLAPSEALIFEWDKCRRLEVALVSKIIKNKWPDELLLTAVLSPHVLWNVLKRAYSFSSQGRKLVWRLYDSIKGGQIEVSVEQRKVIKEFLQIDK